ncbi:phosphate acyltransferase PlsX [Halieaceae bacterium IMCC14734]|uniref:Phosphate acyltransferase n=1 Tax=Candidatus Litorirhabdus singularis TaxID=2518993 RepID=A0ABT3THA3_9GAMM|nr:phosphate acyltransferase PlsX [Candidatus Litorirhabdus singularis]MCX2981379.1 phosphate acyltransferase PlsX [Candidatus Litorirhabdus singularis]
MTAEVRLAVDVMSGDHGLRSSIPAAVRAVDADPELSLTLVGDQALITAALGRTHNSRLSLLPASATVAMDASPLDVLRDSSDNPLRIGLDAVAAGSAAGMVSAGNTGALMVLARQALGMLPGFSRPALCSALPVSNGHSYMLDLGANVDCRAAQLHEFARLGIALVSALHADATPAVALLSNGHEATKGNDQIRLCYQYLQDDPEVNFIGSIEANELLSGNAAVVVCDGMLGNIALKAMEGTAAHAARRLESQLGSSLAARLAAKLLTGPLASWRTTIDPASYSGAFMLGLNGVVVKSHGHSDGDSFANAIAQTALCVRNKMVPTLQQHFKVDAAETRLF